MEVASPQRRQAIPNRPQQPRVHTIVPMRPPAWRLMLPMRRPGSAADLVWACCWVAVMVFGIRAANILAQWHATRPASEECVSTAAWCTTDTGSGLRRAEYSSSPSCFYLLHLHRRQAKLQPALRKLMGLPPAPPK